PEALLATRQQRFDDISARLPAPAEILDRRMERFAAIAARLPQGLRKAADDARHRLAGPTARFQPSLLHRYLNLKREALDGLATRAAREGEAQIRVAGADLEKIGTRLAPALIERLATSTKRRLDDLGRVLTSLDPRGPLTRGFALVETMEGGVVTSAATARKTVRLRLRFADDAVDVVTGDDMPAKPKARAKPKAGPAGQKELF
ncbi:MAG: exodeoxyribonuclease VII large subunit, partial [Pacificimonas sp.]